MLSLGRGKRSAESILDMVWGSALGSSKGVRMVQHRAWLVHQDHKKQHLKAASEKSNKSVKYSYKLLCFPIY